MMTRNLLDELGTSLDPPASGPAEQIPYRLVAAMTAERPVDRRTLSRYGRVPALGRRLAGATALAAAITVAVLVAQSVGIGSYRPAAANAADVLHHAADAAQNAPELHPRPDQFVFVDSIGQIGTTGPTSPERQQTWLSVDGSRPGTGRFRVDGGPLGWQNAIPAPGLRGYRTDLPTDPARLLTYLTDHPLFPVGKDGQPWVFDTAGAILANSYLPPRTQAALLRALAMIPGTTVVPDAVDAAGRHGVAIRQPAPTGDDHELIFSSDTYAFLGALTRTGRGAGPGTDKFFLTAKLQIAIVDKAGQLPG